MELRFTAGIDRNQFKSDIDAMRRDILGLNNTVKSETSKMDSSFKNLSLGIAGYFSVNAVQGFVRELINVRGEFQKTEIAFTTMLGNADQAKSLMADMVELAAKTPFSLQDVSSGAKQLLAFQVPANEVVDTLTRLGNIAAGLSVPLSRINLVYGQVKAKGKLMGDDLRQFTEAGIPMVAELAKKFGTTTSAITEMVSAGKIGFKDVQDVLFSMTNEGGMFFNLMEKQSKSLSGQIANLGDSWDQMLNKIGEANEGILSDGIQGLTYLVQHYEDVIQVVGTLVATYGAYRAALIAANALNKASILIESTQAAIRFAQGISGMTKAQLLFNSAARTNPYVLLATGIAAVVGAFVYYKTGAEDAADATKQLNDSLETAYKESGKEVSKLSELYKKASDLKTSTDERKKAIKELQTLYPSYFGNLDSEAFKTGKAKDAYYELRDAIVASAKARAAQAELERRSGEYIKNREKLVKNRNNFINDMKNSSDREIDRGDGGVIIVDEDVSKFNNRQKAIDAQNKIFALDKKFENDNKELLDIKEENEKKASKLENDREKRIENSVNSNSGTKAVKDKNKEVEKLYGEDTIKGLQQRISKLQEIIETSVIGSDAYNKAFSDKEKFEKRLKEIQEQSFDEQISELKRQFSVRDKLLESGYSKETVDGMFPEIKDKNLLQSMQDQAKALSDIINSGKGNSQTAENLSNINEQIRVMLGQKSALEDFSKNLDLGRNGKSSSEYIDFLNSQKTTGGSELELAKNAEIQKRIDAEIEAQKQRYQEFLAAHQSFEERKNAITENYAGLRQKIEADTTLNNEQKKNALEKAAQEEADAYSDAFMTELVNNPQYREAFTDLDRQTTSKLLELRNQLQNSLSNNKNLNPEAQAKIRKDIQELNSLIGSKNPYILIRDAIKSFGNESLSAKDKLEILSNAIAATNKYLDLFENIVNSVESTLSQLGVSTDNLFGDILNNVKNTISGIKESLQGVEDLKSSYNDYLEAKDAGDTLGKLTAGFGMLGAGIKIVSGAIKAVSGWLSGDNKKERQIKAWANEVKNLKVQYQELERAIDKALGDDKYKAQQTVIANLEKQKILLQQMIQKEKDKKKTDNGKIDDWKQQISDINAQIDDLKKSIVDNILQIDVKGLADKIGDALIEGFGRGEDALDSLNKTADEVFKDMVKNALKMELEKKMQPIIDEMLKAMGYSSSVNDDAIKAQIEALEKQRDAIKIQGNIFEQLAAINKIKELNDAITLLKTKLGETTGSFDGLTEEERAALKAQIIAATGDYQKAMEQYADLFGPDAANSPNGLKGDIKGMTEKTGGALESQINAIRIYQVEALNISKRNQQIFLDSLRHQAEIASNTRSLLPMKTILEDILTKLKKL